jgi:GntR family phosphonate transport system transcriptional regulator
MAQDSGKTPLWVAIANAIRNDLSEGRYRPGDKLPTEAALSDRFGVNRHTVRHALSALVEDGLVYTRRGAGAFVKGVPTEYPLGKRVRYHQSLRAAGKDPYKKVLSVETRPATAEEAERLELNTGDQIVIHHGLSFADGQPIAFYESQFPEARLSGLAKVLETETSVTAALKQVGVADYTRASTRLRARQADATLALHLELREGAPVLYSTSLNVDMAGVPVEYGMTWFAGDRVTLTIEENAD